ncbi:hypothetical protein TWF696_006816 [Orbilia brochopaga]|uniref:Uncharacterized protein n=1 Tax=Orbilia brochopaga TaxID=3140254 RepID=A0AAV9UUA5_9PEZI
MHPQVRLASLSGLMPGLCMAMLAIMMILPVAFADPVTFPIEPYWREYLDQEADTIATMAEEIDKYKIRRLFACPLGGPEDTTMLQTGYPRSLTFLLRVLVNAWRNFGAAIDRMQSPDPLVAQRELDYFGLENVGQAESQHRLLGDFLKDFVDFRHQIATVFRDIDRIPGLTIPTGVRPEVNLQILALMIEAGRFVNGNVILDTQARAGFTFMFKFAYDKIGQMANEAEHAASVMKNSMGGDAYTQLVTEQDPFAPVAPQQNQGQTQMVPEEPNEELEQGDEQNQSEAIEEEEQPIGPWQENEDGRLELEQGGGQAQQIEEEENGNSSNEDEDEANQNLDWSIPGIFNRIEGLAECWEGPLWEVYDLALNVLGPIPDLSPPTWIERSTFN